MEIQNTRVIPIRKLHSFVGHIISLGPVCGNITRLMTRHSQLLIANSFDEDNLFEINEFCSNELEFWYEHVTRLNIRYNFAEAKTNKIICSHASFIGCGAIVCIDVHVANTQWTDQEAKKSSTWRELSAIEFAISFFLPILKNSSLKIFYR